MPLDGRLVGCSQIGVDGQLAHQHHSAALSHAPVFAQAQCDVGQRTVPFESRVSALPWRHAYLAV